MRDLPEPWILVRELVFSFLIPALERHCAGQCRRAIQGGSAKNAGISVEREYTPQHFNLEALLELPLDKYQLTCKEVFTTKWNYCAGPA
jgi:hypothetical protein